jgi:hypothetical protein
VSEDTVDRKHLHTVKKNKAPDAPSIEDQHDMALVDAEQKLQDLSVHFPEGTDLSITAESDDDEIRFYVSVSISF